LSLKTGSFNVFARYWTFENLHISGICQEHANCEHSFHIVGKAEHFVAHNNTIVNFNAHFKINAENRAFFDYCIHRRQYPGQPGS